MFYKGELPFVRLLIPLIAGITLTFFCPSKLIADTWIFFALTLFFLLLIFILYYKRYKLYKVSWFAGIVVHALIFIIGAGITAESSGEFNVFNFARTKADYFILEVAEEPVTSNRIIRFEAKVLRSFTRKTALSSTGNLLILLQQNGTSRLHLKYGDLLLVPARYSKIQAPYNPGEFDYKKYLNNRKIYYQSYLNEREVRLLKQDSGNPIKEYALNLRFECVERINKSIGNKDAAALASALILGYRTDLSNEIEEAYSDTGTMHVLSVSGMHVGIVFLVLNVLLKPLEKSKRLIFLRLVLIIGLIWYYALITGLSASVCRAAFMLSFVVIGKSLNKRQNTYNLIAISAFFLLLIDPWYLFDIGFQLSYLAVCGLIYFHPIIYNSIYFKNKIPDIIWSYSALSIAAQIATFPLSIYYFHQFPVYFLISNLLIVIPVAVIMYSGITFLLLPFALVENILGKLLNQLIDFTNKILFKIEELPFALIEGLWISKFELLLISLIIISISIGYSFRLRYMLWQVLILILILSFNFSIRGIDNFNRNEIVFMSLKRNSALVWFNQGKALVISDVNLSDRAIDFSVKPLIGSLGAKESVFTTFDQEARRIKFIQLGNFKMLRWNKDFLRYSFQSEAKLDAVLISHDMVLELKDILARFQVKLILIDGTNSDYKIERWLDEAKRLKIRCYSLKKKPAYVVKL